MKSLLFAYRSQSDPRAASPSVIIALTKLSSTGRNQLFFRMVTTASNSQDVRFEPLNGHAVS